MLERRSVGLAEAQHVIQSVIAEIERIGWELTVAIRVGEAIAAARIAR